MNTDKRWVEDTCCDDMKSEGVPEREKRINSAIGLMRNIGDHVQKLDNRSCDLADRWLQAVASEGKDLKEEPPSETMGLIEYILSHIRYHIEGIDNNLTRLENDL